MSFNRLLASVSLVSAFVSCSTAEPAERKPDKPAPPTLTSAEFFSHTNDDNKDRDTGVYVHVKTSNDQTLLASIENADNSDTDATEYNDGSNHTLKLHVGSRETKQACQNFNVTVRHSTNVNDTWKFNARVTLTFSDGSALYKEESGIVLKNNNASHSF